MLLLRHWLDVPERVQYKLGVVMCSCLDGQVPQYLAGLFVSVSDVSTRQHLQFATRLFCGSAMPAQHMRSTGLLCVRPSLWNSLPDSLRDPDLSRDSFSFRRLLKTHLSHCTDAFSVGLLQMFQDDTFYKHTYVLTYLLTDLHIRLFSFLACADS